MYFTYMYIYMHRFAISVGNYKLQRTINILAGGREYHPVYVKDALPFLLSERECSCHFFSLKRSLRY